MNQRWKKGLTIILVILLLIGISYTNGESRKETLFESIISHLITFPQRGYQYAKNWIMKDAKFFEQVDELQQENKELKEKNEELNAKLMNYEVMVSENGILKEHMNLAESYPDYQVIVADIISDSASNWERVYIINRGEKDGVKPDMAVVAEQGLVGYVISVTSSTAKIVSITDPGNTVSCRITRTRDAVICKGNTSLLLENKIKLLMIPTDVVLVEGDKLETSGLGGRYPKGIPVGQVEKFVVKKNPIENEAIIKPEVDFNKLETVAVIVQDAIHSEE